MSVYRLSPPRKFNWWFRTTANNDWLLANATPAQQPSVQSVVINDGHVQRSKINSITVTFDHSVVLDAGAITLSGRDGAGEGTSLAWANPAGDGRTWVVTFSGTPIVGGSLADGVYDLRVVASAVHSGPGTAMAADYATKFHRLFSDSDGDGDSDNGDMARLRPTYGKVAGDPNYVWYWDYNNDGDVDNADVAQIRSRRSIVYMNY